MKKTVLSILCSAVVFANFAQAEGAKNYLSFKGKASLEAVRAGSLDRTQRLSDRTQAPYLYRENQVVPIVNSDAAEEARSYESQMAENAYGFVKFTKINVTKFENLNAADQADVLKFYTTSQISAAQGIVTQMWIKFQSN